MKGLKSLTDLKEDDIFMYTDGDELPRPELLQFLKLYDGYPQPIAFWYKWSIFGFFWHVNETILESYSAPIPSGKMFFRFFFSFFAKNENAKKVFVGK